MKEWREGAHYILHDPEAMPSPRPELFSAAHWKSLDKVEGTAPGRGAVAFVRGGPRGQVWAVRHYRRGGQVGRWIEDSYLWTGLAATRPWREFQLTHVLRGQRLPVPRPVAAHVVRSGLGYRGDLITERIEGAEPLAQLLERQPLPVEQWTGLGRVLRRFHDAGVRHDDVNARNLLRDAHGQFHLIDFDKARVLPAGAWRAQNLARFRRSLDKFKAAAAGFHFTDVEWTVLMSGYDARS